MAWPGNEQAAVAIGCGHLRASDADRETIRDMVWETVYPADQRFLETLRGAYLAATREDPTRRASDASSPKASVSNSTNSSVR